MTDYKQLASVYLKKNKKRSAVTVAGVALCAALLFVILSLSVSAILTMMKNDRESIGYEVTFFCESMELAEQVAGEDCLKSAEIEEVKDTWRVYVNFKNPYRLEHFADEIALRHGVDYVPSGLGRYYVLDPTENTTVMLALIGLLVAYVFAILGVGVVRNSIQLINLEQFKDYGILRCIGATKGQLRKFVYRMGLILELYGIALGTAIGYPVFYVLAQKLKLQTGFYWGVIPFILLVFLVDLFFVMRENCRFVNRLSPAEAVAGVFRYKDRGEKIKAGRGSLAQKILGFEGAYAYKSLMRNPSRFYKTTRAIGLGIAMIIVIAGVNQCTNSFLMGRSKYYGKYQISARMNSLASIPDRAALDEEREKGKELEAFSSITEAQPIYRTTMFTAGQTELLEHFDTEFSQGSKIAADYRKEAEQLKNGGASEAEKYRAALHCAGISLYGYDKADYQSLKGSLAEGTLDVSEHGIVLVNDMVAASGEDYRIGDGMTSYKVTDYRVGDKITFVDMKKLYSLVAERAAREESGANGYTAAQAERIYYECYQELLSEGSLQTYTVEGILKKDTVFTEPNHFAHFVMPADRYFKETGTSEKDFTGMMYHLKGTGVSGEMTGLLLHLSMTMLEGYQWNYAYMNGLGMVGELKNILIGMAFFVLFIVLMNVLNILNVTASNIHLRRREFAQLRVQGMSKKHLTRMVLLEGVWLWAAANIVGLVLGVGLTVLLLKMIQIMADIEYHFTLGIYLLTALFSLLLLCGSIWVNLKGLRVGMAEELSGGGE